MMDFVWSVSKIIPGTSNLQQGITLNPGEAQLVEYLVNFGALPVPRRGALRDKQLGSILEELTVNFGGRSAMHLWSLVRCT
jgi:hypothetical protein